MQTVLMPATDFSLLMEECIHLMKRTLSERGVTYTLYDLNLDYTKNVMAEYSVYVVLNIAQSDQDYALFYKKLNLISKGLF